MNVQISVRRMPLSLGMQKVISETCNDISLKFNFIKTIEVYLEDINGPYKGGLDKRCHIKVRRQRRLCVDIIEIKRDLYSAIDDAFSRLIQIIKRKLPGKAFGRSASLLENSLSSSNEDGV